jgi:hypothetical protein
MALSGSTIAADNNGPIFQSNADLMEVQNRCIIRLKDTTDSTKVTGLARAMAAKGQSTVKHLYKNSIKGGYSQYALYGSQ